VTESRQAADRVAALRWAQSIANDKRVLYLDTETTGLGDSAEIVDVALISANGSVLFNTLIKPDRPIPADSSRIHGIYDRDVVGAPSWTGVSAWLGTLLSGARVVVYNAEYDSRIINASCARFGSIPMASGWECAMIQYAAFVGERGIYGDYKWHRLERAAAAMGIQPGGHRALEDANACRNVVLAMAGNRH